MIHVELQAGFFQANAFVNHHLFTYSVLARKLGISGVLFN